MALSGCASAVRRLIASEADELAILCRPEGRSDSVVHQTEVVYRELVALLTSNRASFQDLSAETLFLRDIDRDLPGVLAARSRILAEAGQGDSAPAPAFIEQPPADGDAALVLSVSAVVPRRRDAWVVRDVAASPTCPCEGCARSGARIVRLGDQTSLQTANLYGAGEGTFEQALNAFHAAERLLEEHGLSFRDVVRTWIHLRDIERDYDALNQARREFFRARGIERMPASTGVQGGPFPDVHDVSLSLAALRSPRTLQATAMSSPTLNEAWSYGADFSRGLRVAEANKTTLYLSGTASIDEAGRTVHPGDFRAQAERMLHNLASLLAGQGASFGDVVSGVTYLKRPSDASLLRSIFRERGFEGFPCAVVEAPLCRPELLCETEAVAYLPASEG